MVNKDEFYQNLLIENTTFSVVLPFCEFMDNHYVAYQNVSQIGTIHLYIPIEELIQTKVILNNTVTAKDFMPFGCLFYFKPIGNNTILTKIEFDV